MDVKQNTTRPFKIYMADATDLTTAKTGLVSFTVYLSKSGGAELTVSPTIAERGHGWYEVTPLASHRDALGESSWTFVATGAVDFPRVENVVAYDSQEVAVGASTFDHTADQVIVGTNNDKTGYTLTTAERTAVAASVASDILNDGDGSAVMQAIADKIAADWVAGDASPLALVSAMLANPTIAAALANMDAAVSDVPTASEIRTELETDGSKLDHLWETTEDDGGTRRFTSNALEQAPAGGGGGGTATLENQTLIVSMLNGTPIKTVSRVSSGGEIVTYLGDDDTGTDKLLIPVDDTGEVLKTKLQAATSVVFGAGTGSAANQIVGTIDANAISHADDITTIPIEITSAQKAGAKAGPEYTYHIKSVTDGKESVEVEGCLELRNERAAV